jgi:hypothetical protein
MATDAGQYQPTKEPVALYYHLSAQPGVRCFGQVKYRRPPSGCAVPLAFGAEEGLIRVFTLSDDLTHSCTHMRCLMPTRGNQISTAGTTLVAPAQMGAAQILALCTVTVFFFKPAAISNPVELSFRLFL